MEQLRLFWAINLPAQLKAKLAALQEKLKGVDADVKWVEEENFHLTLQFLGNVAAAKLTILTENMQKTLSGFPSFQLQLRGVGFFPNHRRPRVFWTGVAGNLLALQQLQERVQKANLLSGFPAEERDFRPHLTLARLRSNRGLNALLATVKELELSGTVTSVGEFSVTSVDLMKSELSRRGSTYTLLVPVKLI